MKAIADRFVVVLDANVLYPFRIRDILLHLAHAGLYRARWTEDILREWTDSLLSNKPELRASIDQQVATIRQIFPECFVTGYEALISNLDLPDQNDRHILAAAVRCGAQHIVTENLRDFPAATLGPLGIEAVTADSFVAATVELYLTDALVVLRDMRRGYENPPMSPVEFVTDLQRVGLVKTAALVRPNVDLI